MRLSMLEERTHRVLVQNMQLAAQAGALPEESLAAAAVAFNRLVRDFQKQTGKPHEPALEFATDYVHQFYLDPPVV